MRKVLLNSVTSNSGFLENAKVTFSPGLNCIIGARGTCKSTVVESIRFAFNVGQDRVRQVVAEKTPTNPAGIVRETLGVGSVACGFSVIEDDIATDISVEREIGDAPRVLRAGQRDMIYGDALEELEIFSQGDIQKIASEDVPDLRLALIDRPKLARINELKASITIDVVNLRDIGGKLRSLRSEVEAYRLQVKGLDQLRAELAKTVDDRPAVPPSLEALHAQYLRRQRTLELLDEIDASRRAIVTGLRETVGEQRRVQQLGERANDQGHVSSDIPVRLAKELQSFIDDITSVGRRASALNVASEKERLMRDFAALDEAYLQERQVEKNATESLRREDMLRRQIADLEAALRRLEHLEAQQKELSAQRRSRREHLAQLRNEIFELRVDEVDRINAEFSDVVLLTVRRATKSPRYIQKLTELISGSRVRMQDSIAADMAAGLIPDELLEIIEASNAARLSELLDRDLGQVTRIIAYLRDHPELYELEGEWTDDTLEITMFDNGVPKAVEQLSDGQKATALLPLILREANGPLIIDQPEDDLDNSFIYTSLVKSIIGLKTKRQLIFVTHNANIPVLGDADNVVVMSMASPKKAAQPKIGGLEESKQDILELLEGGPEAFARREASYGALLQ